MVTSHKGGIGKSTIASNLAMTLARRGRKTLIIDCDFGNRCLDLLLGCEDGVIFDIYDVCENKTPLEKAILNNNFERNLCFCAAPYQPRGVLSRKGFEEAVVYAKETLGFEYVIIDVPASLSDIFEAVAPAADRAIIVASHSPAAIRAASKTDRLVRELGIEDTKLVINSFDKDGCLYKDRTSILEIIDKTYVGLIGIVPYDEKAMKAQEKGYLAYEVKGANSAAAYENIAKRIEGKDVPLLEGVVKKRRKLWN